MYLYFSIFDNAKEYKKKSKEESWNVICICDPKSIVSIIEGYMKIDTIFRQADTTQYTHNTTNRRQTTASFEAVLNNDDVRSIVSSIPQSTDTLLLLLQDTKAYTGYVENIIEHDILTEAERQYLLTGDIERIEKKNKVVS